MSDIFEGIFGQPQVREFFRASIASGRVTHAYLFTGPTGSNKTMAAYAFAQAILCSDKGCQECGCCKQVMRRKHPDVRYYAPEGAGGYLVEQIREIVADTALAPIQASKKIYIIDRADLLGIQAANAFLKTLEEPPSDVVILLLGRTRESVLPTIVSRCQVVPFRHIPAREAAGILVQNSGASELHANIAIQACGGSITKAMEFLKSNERMLFRGQVIDILSSLRFADDWDILNYAADLVVKVKAPLDVVRAQLEEELAESADFLAKSAIRQIEARNKRMVTATTFDSLRQMTAIIRSWLRDIMMICAERPDLVINTDVQSSLEQAALYVNEASAARALQACARADKAISYNVSPETCIDALFFEIREVLYGTDCADKATK